MSSYGANILRVGEKFFSMHEKELERKLAKIESLYDQLLSDVDNLNQLLQRLGFPKGIISLREAAQELLREIQDHAAYDE